MGINHGTLWIYAKLLTTMVVSQIYYNMVFLLVQFS
jgi:hypothetical protein